jgi:hypothetical protein
MIPLDPNLRPSASGSIVALPTGGTERIEGDLVKALLAAGRIEARVLQVVNQTVLLDFLDLGRAKVRTEAPLRAGDVFTAVVDPPGEADRGAGSEVVRLRIAELRHEPAAPLKPERMAAQLEAMNLPVDSRHQAMARALLRHAGTLSREAMVQLNETLKQLPLRDLEVKAPPPRAAAEPSVTLPTREGTVPKAVPTTPQAAAQAKPPIPPRVLEAAAFLVAKGLPVTEESVDWVSGRLNAPSTSGERLAAIARNLPDLPPAAAQALAELTLPEGDAAETAAHLAKLARAFTAPEARIARELAREDEATRLSAVAAKDVPPPEAKDAARPERSEPHPTARAVPEAARPGLEGRAIAEPLLKIREALSAVLERTMRVGEGGEPLREALSEVRFGQLVNASTSEGPQAAAERTVAMPLWWNGGSGEIRVQYRSKDGKKRSSGGSEETRVVVTLDTTHLQRVRIDLLLGRKQLNCQVVVEEAAVADLLRQQLPELQAALESTGLRVNALGVRHAAAKATAAPLDSLRQVDVWL